MRKIINTICLIMWAICFIIDVVYTVRGVTISPVTAMLPTLVCVMLYAEKLSKE